MTIRVFSMLCALSAANAQSLESFSLSTNSEAAAEEASIKSSFEAKDFNLSLTSTCIEEPTSSSNRAFDLGPVFHAAKADDAVVADPIEPEILAAVDQATDLSRSNFVLQFDTMSLPYFDNMTFKEDLLKMPQEIYLPVDRAPTMSAMIGRVPGYDMVRIERIQNGELPRINMAEVHDDVTQQPFGILFSWDN